LIILTPYIVEKTELFAKWHESIKDQKAKIAIARRIERAEHGNLGGAKTLGNGISEMRIDIGVGYRSLLCRTRKSRCYFIGLRNKEFTTVGY
jgi:putative addiction module killer protein